MLRQGPTVPPSGTVIHQRTIQTQSQVPPAIVIAPPLPPSVIAIVPPAPQPHHGVRIVHHHGHNPHHRHHHHHGAPGLVGIHKPPHVHHARVMNTHGPAILPGHAISGGQQPSLRAMAVSHHGTNVRVASTSTVPHATPHPAHPTHTNHPSIARRVIHK